MKRPDFECTASHSCLCCQAMGLCLFNVCLSSHLHFWNREAATEQNKWWPLLRLSTLLVYGRNLVQILTQSFRQGLVLNSFNHINLSQKEYCEEHKTALLHPCGIKGTNVTTFRSTQRQSHLFLSFIHTGIKQNLSLIQLLKNVGEERPSA